MKKIKVIIEHKIESLSWLFSKCNIIKKINFIKFNRNNIKTMCGMFSRCKYFEEINFYKFNTDNVTNMSELFYECSLLNKYIFQILIPLM